MLKNKKNPMAIIKQIAPVMMIVFASPLFATNWDKPKEIKDGYAGQVEVIENQDGTLSVFSIETAKEVVYRRQTGPGGSEWGKPNNMDIYANSIKLGSHEDGRIELFAIGTLGNVVTHISQVAPNSDEWTGEEEIDGIYASQIELANNQDDSLVAFFVDMDREISYIRQMAPNSKEWASPRKMDTYANQIAVGNHVDGRLAVFNIGTLGNVISYQSQLKANGDEWSKEQEIKGVYGRQIEVGMNLDGTMNLFILQMDREIAYIRQTAPGADSWTGIHNLDTYGNLIEVGNKADGKIELAIVGTMGNVLTQMTQKEASADEWTKEKELGGYAKQMRFGSNADGRLELVFIAPFASQMFSISEIR